ncbi:hypothetical protein QZH41_017988, partial [Actinostola sp. cb2023]
YGRIILAFISFYYMPFDPIKAVVTYLISGPVLDEFDGRAARYFNQCTKFGALIDMLTDSCQSPPPPISSGGGLILNKRLLYTRSLTVFTSIIIVIHVLSHYRCVTTGLLMMLSVFYPSNLLLFQFLVCLDISSHWIHVQTAMMIGSSHKAIDLSGNYFLRIYYKEVVLSIFCAGNELFFCMLYLIHFSPGPIITITGSTFHLWTSLAVITAPICIIKQTISVIQLYAACYSISLVDEEERAKVTNSD